MKKTAINYTSAEVINKIIIAEQRMVEYYNVKRR